MEARAAAIRHRVVERSSLEWSHCTRDDVPDHGAALGEDDSIVCPESDREIGYPDRTKRDGPYAAQLS